MNFFEQLQQQTEVDLTIRIMKKGDKLTMNVMPGSSNSTSQPIIVSGSGKDLDEAFFTTVFPGVQEIGAMTSNIEEVKSKTREAAEIASSKKADKPAAKKDDKKSTPAKKEAPKAAEPNLFAGDDAEEQKEEVDEDTTEA